MRNGWTGGQYSLFRILFGTYLALVFLDVFLDAIQEPGTTGVQLTSIAGAAVSLAFALGFRDRAMAVLLLVAGGVFAMIDPRALGPGAVLSAWILVLHFFLPAAPYGSIDAISRIDPGNAWRMSDVVHTAHWIALSVALVGLSVVVWHPDWGEKWRLLPEIVARGPRATLVSVLTLAVAPLALLPRLRRFAWIAAGLAAVLGFALAVDERPFLGLAALLVVAFEPKWIAPRDPAACDLVLFDGTCGLCHRAVRFVLAEDERQDRFHFAPLGGDAFRERIDATTRNELPDSIVVQATDGSLHVRSAATIRIGRRLGGLWRLAAETLALVPAPPRDAGYDAVARVRRTLFARPEAACPVLPPHLRRRFVEGLNDTETR